MRKNKQKRKIKDGKHAHLKAKKDDTVPYLDRKTGDYHYTSNRNPFSRFFKAIVEWRDSTKAANISIKPIHDNTEEE